MIALIEIKVRTIQVRRLCDAGNLDWRHAMVTSTRASWPMTRNVQCRTAGLLDMLRVLGIAPAKAARIDHGDAWFSACSACISCPSARACRHLLAGVERLAEPPAFCPNRDYLARCMRRA
jgi:hypothetical protein